MGGADCDTDDDCKSGLICEHGGAGRYGFKKSWWWGHGDVCSKPRGIRLHEGDAGTQDVVCDIWSTYSHAGNFQKDNTYLERDCDNDEARSLTLHHAPKNTRITLFDDPYGRYGKDDEFIIEIWGKDLDHTVLIPTFDLTSHLFNIEDERSLNISSNRKLNLEELHIVKLTHKLKPGSTDTDGMNGKGSSIKIELSVQPSPPTTGTEIMQAQMAEDCINWRLCKHAYYAAFLAGKGLGYVGTFLTFSALMALL